MTADLLEQIPKWEREAERFEEKARALRAMIEAVRDAASVLNGDAERLLAARSNQYDPEDGPRGRDAVRRIVKERPGLWRVAEIKAEVKRRGWPSSAAAVETAVKRLREDGEAVFVKKGVYRFGTDGAAVPEFVPAPMPEQEAADPTDVHRQDGEGLWGSGGTYT